MPLSPLVDHPPVHRKFRTSNQTPFAAEMVWEKFSCKKTCVNPCLDLCAYSLMTSSFKGPQVRLVLNGATFPLSICNQTEKDREYGTCSLEEFVRANAYSMEVAYHSKTWNATCGPGP